MAHTTHTPDAGGGHEGRAGGDGDTPRGAEHHAGRAHPVEEHPERHEHFDVNVVGIYVFTAALLFVTGVTLLLIVLIANRYRAVAERDDATARPTAIVAPPQRPAENVPRIQGIPGFHTNPPATDMKVWRAQNKARLTSYGPTTRPGVIHIPVARAIELATGPQMQKQLFTARAPATRPAGEVQNVSE